MRFDYDPEVDALYLRLSESPVLDSEEVRPGIILDFDEQGRVVGVEDLSESVRGDAPQADEAASSPADGLHQRVEALEREMIAASLAASGGNQQRAARDLGLSRQGLIKKMKRYGLHPSVAR